MPSTIAPPASLRRTFKRFAGSLRLLALVAGLSLGIQNICIGAELPANTEPSQDHTGHPEPTSSPFPKLKKASDYPLVAVYFDTQEIVGLRLAASVDGYRWIEITDMFGVNFKPSVGSWRIMRDPSFARGPDGAFHLTWTSGREGFGYAHSKDLVNWSEPRFITINHGDLADSDPRATWAPDVVYDQNRGEFIVSFAYATQTIPGLQSSYKGDFQIYYVTTKDFETFSAPKLLLNPHPDIYEIDPALIKNGNGYTAFFKIESNNRTDGRKDGIHYAFADKLEGPWSPPSAERLPNNLDNSEGPSPIKLGKNFIVYYDRPAGLQAATSKDLRHWTDITDKLDAPYNFRHGTIRVLNPPLSDEKDNKGFFSLFKFGNH